MTVLGGCAAVPLVLLFPGGSENSRAEQRVILLNGIDVKVTCNKVKLFNHYYTAGYLCICWGTT